MGIAKSLNQDSSQLCANFCLRQHLIDCRGDAALVIGKRYVPAGSAKIVSCISHDKWMPGKGKHLNIVVVVSNGHDLGAWYASVTGPALERVSLRASAVQNVHNRQIAHRIFRPK